MGTLKKYLPFILVAAIVLYFRNEILSAVPGPVKSNFRA